jgi:hypothetical protein
MDVHPTSDPQIIVNKIITVCASQFLKLLMHKSKLNNGVYTNAH